MARYLRLKESTGGGHAVVWKNLSTPIAVSANLWIDITVSFVGLDDSDEGSPVIFTVGDGTWETPIAHDLGGVELDYESSGRGFYSWLDGGTPSWSPEELAGPVAEDTAYTIRAHFGPDTPSGGFASRLLDVTIDGTEVATTLRHGYNNSLGYVALTPMYGAAINEVRIHSIKIGTTAGGGEILARDYEAGDAFPSGWTGFATGDDGTVEMVGGDGDGGGGGPASMTIGEPTTGTSRHGKR